MPQSDPHTLALLEHVTGERETRELADSPDSVLLSRLRTGQSQIRHFASYAISAAEQALIVGIALGQMLEILFRRHDGEFAHWLSLVKNPDGSEWMSEDTAHRYRNLWKKREQVRPTDGREPTCRAKTEAYIKLRLLPDPEQTDRDPNAIEQPFRASIKLPTQAPDTLPPAIKRDVITKLEQPAIYYLRCLDHAQRVALFDKVDAA